MLQHDGRGEPNRDEDQANERRQPNRRRHDCRNDQYREPNGHPHQEPAQALFAVESAHMCTTSSTAWRVLGSFWNTRASEATRRRTSRRPLLSRLHPALDEDGRGLLEPSLASGTVRHRNPARARRSHRRGCGTRCLPRQLVRARDGSREGGERSPTFLSVITDRRDRGFPRRHC